MHRNPEDQQSKHGMMADKVTDEGSSDTMDIVLASNNAGKLREFSAILGAAGFRITPQGELGVSEAEEPYDTFLENALTKARHASRQTGRPALADDSGLCVDALQGAPGVLSARYAAIANGTPRSDTDNNAFLVSQLKSHENRKARYVAVLVYVRHANDPCPIVAQGEWAGEIVDEARGEHGFGYDPHFYIPGQGMTVAQLPPEQKNRISHRGQALQALLAALKAREGVA